MTFGLRYNPALDGLRAVAVVMVIADHCKAPAFDQGYFGVDLFFVLSGFLITRLLTDEIGATGRIDLSRFYLRRLLRLTPPLLLFLAAYLLIAPSLWPQFDFAAHARDVGLVALYVSDYSQAFWHNPKVLVHTWSLAVEEHFGAISYGMYLWHYPVAVYFRDHTPWHLTGPIVLGFSIGMATISYLIIERPLQRYRRSLGEYQRHAEAPRISGADDLTQATVAVTVMR